MCCEEGYQAFETSLMSLVEPIMNATFVALFFMILVKMMTRN